MRILSEEQAGELASAIVGAGLSPLDTAAELVRHEVSARRQCPGHLVARRVCRLAAPVTALDPEMVQNVCDELEREGDLVLAEGGLLYATPVRIVVLGGGAYRFVCTLPSVRLVASVAGDWSRQRLRRVCKPGRPVEEIATNLRGVVLTPEAWAGLDRVPPADGEWLRGLASRLSWAPEPAGSLESDEPLQWSAFVVVDGEPRWRTSASDGLWRARRRGTRWVYAWAPGGSPVSHPFVSLYPDEGARTVYALAGVAGAPVRAGVSRAQGSVSITIPVWLPQAEYRYLSTCGEPVDPAGRGSRWAVPAERANVVLGTLVNRLGLRVEEETK